MKTFLSAVLCLSCTAAAAQAPALVRDSRSKVISTGPQRLTVWNGSLYYSAATPAHGNELWVYNGIDTPRLVVDENPGAANTFDANFRDRMAVCRNRLFFRASSAKGDGDELFSFTGSPPLNLEADLNSVNPKGSSPDGFIAVGNKLYFRAIGPTILNGYYVSDGSGPPRFVVTPDDGRGDDLPVEYGGKLYFGKDPGTGTGLELCAIDPATDTWKLVADIDPGPGRSDPHSMATALGKLYFLAKTAANGLELYSYDGASVKRETDMQPGPADGFAHLDAFVAGFKGDLYFANVPYSTSPLVHLYRMNPATGAATPVTPPTMKYVIVNNAPVEFDNALYFYGFTTTNGVELWKYDGTSCTMVADLFPGKDNGVEYIRPVVYKNALYFSGRKSGTLFELYRVAAKSTSVEAVSWSGKLSVSPNPAQDLVRFDLVLPKAGCLHLSITDISGRTVASKDLGNLPVGAHHSSISLGELPTGQYFYRLTDGSSMLVSGSVLKN